MCLSKAQDGGRCVGRRSVAAAPLLPSVDHFTGMVRKVVSITGELPILSEEP